MRPALPPSPTVGPCLPALRSERQVLLRPPHSQLCGYPSVPGESPPCPRGPAPAPHCAEGPPARSATRTSPPWDNFLKGPRDRFRSWDGCRLGPAWRARSVRPVGDAPPRRSVSVIGSLPWAGLRTLGLGWRPSRGDSQVCGPECKGLLPSVPLRFTAPSITRPRGQTCADLECGAGDLGWLVFQGRVQAGWLQGCGTGPAEAQ